MVIIIMMMIRINKSHNSFLCCFASYSATLAEGWNNFRPTSLLNCRSLSLIIYMFIHVNIQTGGWFCRGCDCQIPTAKDWKDTEPKYNISETIRNIVKLCYFSVDKIFEKETLPLTTKNWAVIYNFIGTHFKIDQNFLKQNTETTMIFLAKK